MEKELVGGGLVEGEKVEGEGGGRAGGGREGGGLEGGEKVEGGLEGGRALLLPNKDGLIEASAPFHGKTNSSAQTSQT